MEGVCLYCKYLQQRESDTTPDEIFYSCKAFPDGIPGTIRLGKWDHRRPYPEGDNDIQFELSVLYDELPDDIQYPSEADQNKWYRLYERIKNERQQSD